MAIGGTVGVATSWTGIGAVVGGAAVIHGADAAAAGIMELWTGKSQKPLTEQGIGQGLQAVGVPEQKANMVTGYADAAISIGLTIGAGTVTNAAKVETAISQGVPKSQSGIVNAATEATAAQGGSCREGGSAVYQVKFSTWARNAHRI
jgi:hypothetical protein